MQDPCQLIHQADHEAAKESDKEQKMENVSSLKWDANRALSRIKTGGRFAPGAVRTDVYKHNLEIFKAWQYEAPRVCIGKKCLPPKSRPATKPQRQVVPTRIAWWSQKP